MASNNQGNSNDDLALDIEDFGNEGSEEVTNNEQGPQNHGSNHDKVTQILSGWRHKKKAPERPSRENGDGILTAWGDGGSESKQQRNVPKSEEKSKTNWKRAFHLPHLHLHRSKGSQDEPEADDALDDEEENRTFVNDKIEDLEEQVKEWKKLLKSVSNDKTEEHVKRKVDEFLSSQEMKRLK